jgi:hypothetical protein
MIVIGTDTHKRTHALWAVEEGTGKVRGTRQIDADEPGHLAGVKWARGLDRGCRVNDWRSRAASVVLAGSPGDWADPSARGRIGRRSGGPGALRAGCAGPGEPF